MAFCLFSQRHHCSELLVYTVSNSSLKFYRPILHARYLRFKRAIIGDNFLKEGEETVSVSCVNQPLDFIHMRLPDLFACLGSDGADDERMFGSLRFLFMVKQLFIEFFTGTKAGKSYFYIFPGSFACQDN
jgi:hypothetical protein